MKILQISLHISEVWLRVKILHNLVTCKCNDARQQKERAWWSDCSRHGGGRNNGASFPSVPGAVLPYRQSAAERLNGQSLSGVLGDHYDVRLHHVPYYDSGAAHEPGRPGALHAKRSRRHSDVHLSLDTYPQVTRPRLWSSNTSFSLYCTFRHLSPFSSGVFYNDFCHFLQST